MILYTCGYCDRRTLKRKILDQICFVFLFWKILSIYSNTQIFSSFSTSISNDLYNLLLLCAINHFKKTIKMFVCRLCILCNPARPIGNICLWWHFCKITFHCFLLILRHFHVKYLVSGTSSSICKRYTRIWQCPLANRLMLCCKCSAPGKLPSKFTMSKKPYI